jgi:hypothetical protein
MKRNLHTAITALLKGPDRSLYKNGAVFHKYYKNHHPMRTKIPHLLLTAILALTPALASAAVIVDFNGYPTATFLSGQNTNLSTGLSAGTWSAGGSPKTFTAADLTSTYAIAQTGTAKVLQASVNTSTTSAATATIASPLNGTVYFSFLTQWSSATARSGLVFNGAGADAVSGVNLVTVAGDATTPLRLRAATSGTNLATSLMPTSITATNFFVGEIVFSGTLATINVWVNPDLSGGTLPGAPSLTASNVAMGSTSLNSIGVFTYGGTVNTSTLDNVRFGSALSDVAVPEPSTWALLAFSLTAVMVLRRRRRC